MPDIKTAKVNDDEPPPLAGFNLKELHNYEVRMYLLPRGMKSGASAVSFAFILPGTNKGFIHTTSLAVLQMAMGAMLAYDGQFPQDYGAFKCDWIWDEAIGHMPCCTQMVIDDNGAIRKCGNGPLTGDQLQSGDCEQHNVEN